jgi:hypothetical protein
MSNALPAPPPEPEEYGHIISYYDEVDDEPENPPPPSAPVATLRNGVMNGQASGPLPPRQASLHVDTSPNDPPPGEQQPRQITHTLVKHLQ